MLIIKEKKELENNPVPNWSAAPIGDDMFNWEASVIGSVNFIFCVVVCLFALYYTLFSKKSYDCVDLSL